MKKLIFALAILLPVAAWADSHESDVYIYATYMYCDTSMEEAADATFDKYFRPEFDNSMKSGDFTGWGYLKHIAGGKWRRLIYRMGPGVVEVLNASKKQGDAVDKKLRPRDDNLGKACKSHDDYIWKSELGNVTEQRGKVGLSVYFVCDMNGESRADELVEKEFGPAYDAHLGPGKLSSWGWLSHVVGGKYRRLLTTSAESLEDLFAARAELLGGFAGSSAGREFSSICGMHSDYIWEIAAEGR
ncbi:MAG: hypothetical protein KJO54_11350 [Gammaproteobacteria bacterium]|nr:hypothetical protein [Gammaproteobacteria bacterium]NNF61297.1 hypothetical protein [Gammaproteobacteria bacterium]NNM20798.1 hypothetical protein [Gammaproteobacteria bacterium]